MLYLLDANVLITAERDYYRIGQVPEFWGWLVHHARQGNIKMPQEMVEEILKGRKDNDPLLDWLKSEGVQDALTLDEPVDGTLLQQVVAQGYGSNLTDVQIETIGRDPFIVAYALRDPANRVVVSDETSRPSRKGHNRKVPDVCSDLGIRCCKVYALNKDLKFSTAWEREIKNS